MRQARADVRGPAERGGGRAPHHWGEALLCCTVLYYCAVWQVRLPDDESDRVVHRGGRCCTRLYWAVLL